jgi:hypothetical protein
MLLLPWPPPDEANAAFAASAADTATVPEPFLRARRFGAHPSDLDLDCGDRDRATAVTRILAACLADALGHPLEAGRIWEASLAWRLQGLLAVAAATRGYALEAEGACPREGCEEALEFSLDLRDFAMTRPPERIEWRVEGSVVPVRLPNGLDQRRWTVSPPQDWASMAQALLERVDEGASEGGYGGGLPPHDLEALSVQLEAADPLTSLKVEAACPRCGCTSSLEMDLESILLKSLAAEQQSLVRDVHALASAFHWSEADILALSSPRRAKYLHMIEAF